MSRSKSDKRRELVVGAARAFLKRGFTGTTMQDIAAACGVGKGTLYEYFPSKEDLFIELCLTELDVDPETIDAAFLQTDDPHATLAGVIDAMFAAVPGVLERMPLYFTLWARLSYDERYRDKCHRGFRELYRGFREALARGLARAQEQGSIRRDLDPRDLASAIMCVFDGYAYLRVFAAGDVDAERLERTLANVLLAGMAATEEATS